MADTTTANLGLLIADLNDVFNFGAHVEANFTTIDGLMGLVKCTSVSRPSTTYGGQGIFETDTLRVAVNSGTKASPVWTYVSHAALAGTLAGRPTLGRSVGELYYETDTLRLVVWNGAAWEQKAFSNFVCTSSTHPASPFQGMEIYETDTGLSAVYSGSNYQYSLQQIAPTQVLVGTTASVTFSGIPTGVTRLVLYWRARSSASGQVGVQMQIDGNTGNNYLWSNLQNSAASVGAFHSGGLVSFIQIGAADGNTANYFGSGVQAIDGWNTSTGFTTTSGHWNSFSTTTTDQGGIIGGQFNVVGPHNSVKLQLSANSFAAGTEFSLYAAM